MYKLITTLTLLSLTAPACASYKLEPPAGFVEVQHSKHSSRMKASDNVGLSVRVFHNHRGGTLAFWSEDLVHKLADRGYRLEKHTAVKSKNGVTGTRMDFAYEKPGESSEPKFYSAVLFVTDGHRVVMQLAGDAEQRDRYVGQLDRIAADLKVRGCKPASRVCDGPQPSALATATTAAEPQPDGAATEEPAPT